MSPSPRSGLPMCRRSVPILAVALAGSLASPGVLAADAGAPPEHSGPCACAVARPTKAKPPFALSVSGYGELAFLFHDHGPDRSGEGGAPPDRRFVFDQVRFVAALEGEIVGGIEFEAEVEFEHGGTGVSMELEYEEYGEFEQEVERGGEIQLEELYVQKEFGEHVSLKAGRFYVAVGQLHAAHRPTDYLGLLRPEGEVTAIPGVWDEMGIELAVKFRPIRAVVQVVDGLDSSGFGSDSWVASGHQQRFELIQARSLAVVGRVDVAPAPGISAGASVYYGDTVGNRPKPDMEGIAAPLLILDGHFSLDVWRIRARGALIWGRLEGAETVSEYNRRLSNELDVPRTAVADQALAAWLDFGVNVLPQALGIHRLEPFGRVERYDTMFRVGPDTFDNPRYDRTVLSAGAAYTYRDAVFARLAWSRRSFGEPSLRPETTLGLTTGFTF